MYNLFKSRTFWAVIAAFVVGGGNAITGMLPPEGSAILSALLGVAAIYFHINPSQTYNTSGIK